MINEIKAFSNADLGTFISSMADGLVEGMLEEKMTLAEHNATIIMVGAMKEAAERLKKSS